MIESREKRKAKTLMHRRKVGIIASLIIAALLITSSALIYNYFTSVYYFTDADGVTKYKIKKVDGVFGLYDLDDVECPTSIPPNSDLELHVTEIGTMVSIDDATGEYEVIVVPDLEFESDGETLYATEQIAVFKGVESADIRSIDINNQNDSYTLYRYSFETLRQDDKGGFVLKHSPLSTLNDQLLSYIVYYTGHTFVKYRLEDPIKDGNGKFSEYGLVAETRYDEDGNPYEYTPTSYTVTTTQGIKHTIVWGDRLVDGSGYYVQYINNDGTARDAVYVYNPPDSSSMGELLEGNVHDTILGKATDLVEPTIVYPMTNNDYYDVTDFKVQHRLEDGSLDEVVSLDYIDIALREDSVAKNEPYVFNETSFKGYTANTTSIDIVLQGLMRAEIVEINVLSPSNEDKVKYNLKTKTEQPDGTFKYTYSSKYVVEFDKIITDSKGGKQKVRQTLYVSEPNENGNYHVFTEIRLLETADDSPIKGISMDSICEVSPETMGFVAWDVYEWIYPKFLQYDLSYVDKIEISSPQYNASFDVNYTKKNDINILTVIAKDDKGNSLTTFGAIDFVDYAGNSWLITPDRIYVTDANGNEAKPESLHFEHNDLGEQIHVIDSYARTKDGDLIYVTKNEIKIQRANGTTETHLRYRNTIFKNVFLSITNLGIIDSYIISDEEEQALVSDPNKLLMNIKVYDTEGNMKECNFYAITERKSYLTLGSEDPVGGFYIQTTKLNKIISDCQKFFRGEAVDWEAHK